MTSPSESPVPPTESARYLDTEAACAYLGGIDRSTLYRDAQLAMCASRVGRRRGKLLWDRNAIDLVMALRAGAPLDRAA